MTETATARFGFTHWGNSATDGPSMAEFNSAFTALETLAAKMTQGVLASRPTAGEAQRFYFATDDNTVYYDNGTTWKVVGAITVDEVVRSSGTGTVPITVNAGVGQTADLLKLQVNSVDKATFTKDGNLNVGKVVSFNQDVASSDGAVRGIRVTGHATQTADLLALRNNAGTDQFIVGAAGAIGSTFFAAEADRAVVGGTGFTTLANQVTFTGNAAMEVRSTKGGTGTYNDGLVIRHPSFTSSAVSRRLGVLLKMGDEISGDVAKAGGLYIESALANAATPKLVLSLADAAAMTFFPGAQAQIHGQGLIVESTLDINKTGAASARLNTNVALGAQGGSKYERIAAGSSWYFYADGVHSDTPGAPGSGGSTAASLTAAGLWTAPRANFTSSAGTTLAESAPALMVGTSGSNNVIVGAQSIQQRNNGAAGTLTMNAAGGNLNLGNASYNTNIVGTFSLQGLKLTIAASAPSSPSTGDVWIDI